MATFQEIRQRPNPRKPGECRRCHKQMAQGEQRGKVQIVLYALDYIPRADQVPGKPKQATETITSETRVLCESCSVELYQELDEILPERQINSGGRGRKQPGGGYGIKKVPLG